MPAITEFTVDLLGPLERKRLVAAVDFPGHQVEGTKALGPYHRFNLESVVAAKPDLVLASKGGNSKESVLALKRLGLQVFVVDPRDLSGVFRSLSLIAQVLHKSEKGALLISKMKRDLEALRVQLGANPKKVAVQLGDHPFVVAGGGTLIQELLQWVGVKNIFSDLKGYPRVSVETLLKRSPDKLVVMRMGEKGGVVRKSVQKWKKLISGPRRVVIFSDDNLLRPSPSMVPALKKLKELIDE